MDVNCPATGAARRALFVSYRHNFLVFFLGDKINFEGIKAF